MLVESLCPQSLEGLKKESLLRNVEDPQALPLSPECSESNPESLCPVLYSLPGFLIKLCSYVHAVYELISVRWRTVKFWKYKKHFMGKREPEGHWATLFFAEENQLNVGKKILRSWEAKCPHMHSLCKPAGRSTRRSTRMLLSTSQSSPRSAQRGGRHVC